ncbi:uncharacterized protein LOC125953730 [Anopheles darlingi]|uniref:uncharacterized protein LOC125953730 n=1 Tax=Anopheles darlingi TaxID=43151 RepID=UPI0021001F16|nr:uncharacterized protein LOC125953730 [Anopheles darlingi]
MSEMISTECETEIDSLPEEVLGMIFDHLDLENVKNASLTCRRWCNIIFLSAYINRFRLRIISPSAKARLQLWMKHVTDTVNRSQRRYRNLRLFVGLHMVPDFLLFWETLLKKLTQYIYSLQLSLPDHLPENVISLISAGIQLMSKLRSLSFFARGLSHQQIVLRSSSVEHLEVDDGYEILLDMPELQSFTGPLGALKQPFNNNYQGLEIRKLKLVTVTKGPDDINDLSIIHRLAHVERLKLSFPLDDNRFLFAICNTCTTLKELWIFGELIVTHPATIRNLTNLVNLRKLIFERIWMKRNASFTLDVDLSRLTQLEVLHLGSNAFWKPTSSIRLPKSIRSILMPVTVETEIGVMQSIAGSLTQLQKLRLIYPAYRYNTVDTRTIQYLHSLKHLEVVKFVNAESSGSIYHDMEPPLHRMRELLMLNNDSHNASIHGLCQMLPTLELTSAGYI